MVAFGPQTFTLLDTEAKQRGISVQELLRAVIIPEWFKTHSDLSFKNTNPRPVFKNKYGEMRETILSPSSHP
jgi:hypothetical protein